MKFYKLIIKKQAFLALLLIGAIFSVVFSCSDDNTNIALDRTEVVSAFITEFTKYTPSGNIIYMGIYEELPSELAVSNAVEIGTNGKVFSYGEHPYTWNGDAGTMTKWSIDKSTLEPSVDGILSFASSGFKGSAAAPLFVSETKAYFTKLNEGLVIEWNPTSMEISNIYDVTPNPFVSIDGIWTEEYLKYLEDDKIFMPITYLQDEVCCEVIETPGVTVAVFDLTTNKLEYIHDERQKSGKGDFRVDEKGNRYTHPFQYDVFKTQFFGGTDAPIYTYLKFNDDGSFDSSFELSLGEILPIEFLATTILIYNNQLVISYVDSTEHQLPENFDDRYDVWDLPTKQVSIDMTTHEVNEFLGLSSYQGADPVQTNVQGQFFVAFSEPDGTIIRHLLVQNSLNDFSEITKVVGGHIGFFSQLW